MSDLVSASLPSFSGLGSLSQPRRGVVQDFDDAAGLGLVEEDVTPVSSDAVAASGRRWPFHCVAIADGSRHVEIGTRVRFVLGPAPTGVLEARSIVPMGERG